MSKATTKARILAEITNATATNSITPTIVGGIVDEVLELGGRPYKVYTAIITQSGVNAPTAIVLENTLGEISFTHLTGPFSGGQMTIESTGLFTLDKTYISVTQDGNADAFLIYAILNNNNVINLISQISEGVGSDLGGKAFLEIRVYN